MVKMFYKIFKNLLIPDDGVADVLLSDHSLDCLRDGHLVVENYQLLVVGKKIANRVLFVELTDIGLHFLYHFPHLGLLLFLVVLVNLFVSLPVSVQGVIRRALTVRIFI